MTAHCAVFDGARAITETRSVTEPPQRMNFWPAATLCVVLAFALCFATVHLIPLAIRIGVPEPVADNLPFLGFFAGALGGVAAALSKGVRNALAIGFSVFALGALTWLLGLLVEGVLVAANLDEDSVSWVSTAAFWLGIVAGMAGLFAGVLDYAQKLFARDDTDRERERG
jgi:hypothetical protein